MTTRPSAGSSVRDAELDLQYNARAAVPDSAGWIAHYAELAQRVQAWPGFVQPPVYGLAYGDGPDQLLDIFPAPQPCSPVFVFIHGGYWRALSRKDGIFMAPLFHRAGATVVSLDYSLAPAVSLPEILAQIVRAMNWLAANVSRFNGDPERMHVSGHSAGAQLAAMLLLAPHARGAMDIASRFPPPRSASLFSGLFDLRPLLQTHINEWLCMDEAAAQYMSPLLQRPQPGCSVVAVCGAAETDAFRWQTRALAQEWSRAPGVPPVTHIELPGSHHFDCPLSLADAHSSATRAIFGLMGLQHTGDAVFAASDVSGNGAQDHGRSSP